MAAGVSNFHRYPHNLNTFILSVQSFNRHYFSNPAEIAGVVL